MLRFGVASAVRSVLIRPSRDQIGYIANRDFNRVETALFMIPEAFNKKKLSKSRSA